MKQINTIHVTALHHFQHFLSVTTTITYQYIFPGQAALNPLLHRLFLDHDIIFYF